MSRGSKKGQPHATPDKISGTCGKCPCCRKRAAHSTLMQNKAKARSKQSNEISDEELERRFLGYALPK